MRRRSPWVGLAVIVLLVVALVATNFEQLTDRIFTTREPYVLRKSRSGKPSVVGYWTRSRWTGETRERVDFLTSSGNLFSRKKVGPWSVSDSYSTNLTVWNDDGTIRAQSYWDPDRTPGGALSVRREPPWMWGERDHPGIRSPRWLFRWLQQQR